MYLSRLVLDIRNRSARRALADCHDLHRLIMTGFPQASRDGLARAEFGVLFRVEAATTAHVPVLVQSGERPRWAFPEDGTVVRIDGPKPLDAIEAAVVSGARFRFRLRANPTRRIHSRALQDADLSELDASGRWRDPATIPSHERTGVVRRPAREAHAAMAGKRVEIRREEERLAWLGRQGRERLGFELAEARVVPGLDAGELGRVPAAVANPAGVLRSWDRKLTLATALFEGELRVTDTGAFREGLARGVGPGKAFGCGLLSLAPA